MKVRLNPSAGEMDQQGGHQHLSDGDSMPGKGTTGSGQRQEDGQARNRAAQKNRGPNMQMRLAVWSVPGLRGDPQSSHYSRQPLANHETRKETVGALVDLLLMLTKQVKGPLDYGFSDARFYRY